MQWMALMVRAVEAVNFIRWEPAQWHSGVDAGGTLAAATYFDMGRASEPLPAQVANVCEGAVCRLTWSQSCAHDLPMSWLKHLEHWLGMPKPPPIARSARAFELLWLRHTHFRTLGPAGMSQFSLNSAYISQPRW